MLKIIDENLQESIRKRLVEAIKLSGMTQTEIAKRANISNATLSDYIHKKKLPSIETFALLCDVLDISADEILGLN